MSSPPHPAPLVSGCTTFGIAAVTTSPATATMPAARDYGTTPSTSPQVSHPQAAPTDTKADTDVAHAAPSTGETPQSSPQTRSARRQARRRRQRQRKRERRLQELQSEAAVGQASTKAELPASTSHPNSHHVGSTTTTAPYISSFSSSGVPLLAYGIANPAGIDPEVWNAFADGLKPGYPTRHGNEVFELMMTEGKVEEEPESESEPEPEPKRKKNRRRGRGGARRGGRGGGRGRGRGDKSD